MTRATLSPIGLDVTSAAVAAVQIRRERTGLHVHAASLLDRSIADAGATLTPEEARRIEQVLYRQGFAGQDTVLGVPDASLITGVIELPPRSSGAPIDQLAKAELARMSRVDPGAIEAACWDIPAPVRGAEGTSVMAAGCRIAEANVLLDSLEQTGLVVRILDARYWAMARAAEPHLGGVRVGALLHIGHITASLVVVCDQCPVYPRNIPTGGRSDLLRRVQEAGNLTAEAAAVVLEAGNSPTSGGDADSSIGARSSVRDAVQEYAAALADEVAAATGYISHRYGSGIERLILLGIGARTADLAGMLAEVAGIPASVATPRSVASCDKAMERLCGDPALTTALGLAMADARRAA
jgi:Tfp pilus assembly PilM family ATPase